MALKTIHFLSEFRKLVNFRLLFFLPAIFKVVRVHLQLAIFTSVSRAIFDPPRISLFHTWDTPFDSALFRVTSLVRKINNKILKKAAVLF